MKNSSLETIGSTEDLKMGHLKFRYMSNTTKEVISPNEVADCQSKNHNSYFV